jgi:hypothetical protein
MHLETSPISPSVVVSTSSVSPRYNRVPPLGTYQSHRPDMRFAIISNQLFLGKESRPITGPLGRLFVVSLLVVSMRHKLTGCVGSAGCVSKIHVREKAECMGLSPARRESSKSSRAVFRISQPSFSRNVVLESPGAPSPLHVNSGRKLGNIFQRPGKGVRGHGKSSSLEQVCGCTNTRIVP